MSAPNETPARTVARDLLNRADLSRILAAYLEGLAKNVGTDLKVDEKGQLRVVMISSDWDGYELGSPIALVKVLDAAITHYDEGGDKERKKMKKALQELHKFIGEEIQTL